MRYLDNKPQRKSIRQVKVHYTVFLPANLPKRNILEPRAVSHGSGNSHLSGASDWPISTHAYACVRRKLDEIKQLEHSRTQSRLARVRECLIPSNFLPTHAYLIVDIGQSEVKLKRLLLEPCETALRTRIPYPGSP